jgi:hypothetical protein
MPTAKVAGVLELRELDTAQAAVVWFVVMIKRLLGRSGWLISIHFGADAP